MRAVELIAARIAALMSERGWNPTDLSRELERVRPDKFSESWRVQVSSWLKGATPSEENAEALADAFRVDVSEFRPSEETEADRIRREDARHRLEQVVAEREQTIAELKRLLEQERLRAEGFRRELPKPDPRPRANNDR